MSPTASVTVVGAGVIGLTCAHALEQAGHAVTVLAPERPTVSEVAGGLWLPYAAGEGETVMGWALETLGWLEARGFPSREYLHLQADEPWWLTALPAGRVRAARCDELPDGYDHGWMLRVPLVEMPAHLRALAPARYRRRTVGSLEELDGLVVNCSGLAARELASDPAVFAARGQVVHLAAPAGTPACDEDRMIYVLPRRDRTVVGGSYEPGNEDDAVDPAQTRSLLAQAGTLVPGLKDARVLGASAGLRPVRTGGPRVERVGDVIHCYGHGGAGLTLSWGCAQRAVELAAG